MIIARQPQGAADDLVFLPANGEGVVSLSKPWSQVRSEAKLPEGIGLHGLRHSLASHMAMAGAAAGEIMTALGHSQLSTTQRYLHWAENAGRPWPNGPLSVATEALYRQQRKNGQGRAATLDLMHDSGRIEAIRRSSRGAPYEMCVKSSFRSAASGDETKADLRACAERFRQRRLGRLRAIRRGRNRRVQIPRILVRPDHQNLQAFACPFGLGLATDSLRWSCIPLDARRSVNKGNKEQLTKSTVGRRATHTRLPTRKSWLRWTGF